MTLYMMVGIPASGKSTYAKKLGNVCSSDDIREELGTEDNTVVFATLHKRIKDYLNNNKDCVYDATNLNRKKRKNFLFEIAKTDCRKVCVCFLVPLEVCKKRNAERERHVPEYVYHKMLAQFQLPTKAEGFDEVIYITEPTNGNFYRSLAKMNEISHDNPHHEFTIGHHMLTAAKYVDEHFANESDYKNIRAAARFHDIGKPFVKSFFNTKGELTDSAHYYGHDNASAYFFITEIAPMLKGIDPIFVTELINWHMQPFLAWKTSEKAFWRDRRFLGNRKFHALLKVHEADVNAH